MATPGRAVVARAEGVADAVGVAVGAVAAGVHDAIASARVNTCARYLKGK
jgi:hypothetical protein